MKSDNRKQVLFCRAVLLVLVLLLMCFISSCSNETKAPGPFRIGYKSFDTLQSAVDYIKSNSRNSSGTISLTRDTTDSGATIKDVGSVTIDLQSFTYSLSAGNGIIIDSNSSTTEIVGGTIRRVGIASKNGVGGGYEFYPSHNSQK